MRKHVFGICKIKGASPLCGNHEAPFISIYRKVPKFSYTIKNYAVNYLKFKQRGQTIEYFVQKMQMEQQTVKTLIRLLL